MTRLCSDGVVRFVPAPMTTGPQFSVSVERMGNRRRPTHMRPKRTAKAKVRK